MLTDIQPSHPKNSRLTSLSYKTDESYLPIVLLNGTIGQSEDWSLVIDKLPRYRLVLRPSYFSRTTSNRIPKASGLSDLPAEILTSIKEKARGRFHLIGYSFGAPLAVYLAAHYPELVQSLVLISGFAIGHDSRMRLQLDLWSQLLKTDKNALVKMLLLYGSSPEFTSKFDIENMGRLVDAVASSAHWLEIAQAIRIDPTVNVFELAGMIKCRTLSIIGRYDQFVPPACSQQLISQIPNVREVEIATGHLCFLGEPSGSCFPHFRVPIIIRADGPSHRRRSDLTMRGP